MIEVIRSHRYLPLSNMKGVRSIPPSVNESLHQGSTCGPLWKKIDDRLEARFPDVGPSFRDKKVVPFYHLIRASPTSKRG